MQISLHRATSPLKRCLRERECVSSPEDLKVTKFHFLFCRSYTKESEQKE